MYIHIHMKKCNLRSSFFLETFVFIERLFSIRQNLIQNKQTKTPVISILLFGEKITKGLSSLATDIIKGCNLRHESVTATSYRLCVIHTIIIATCYSIAGCISYFLALPF